MLGYAYNSLANQNVRLCMWWVAPANQNWDMGDRGHGGGHREGRGGSIGVCTLCVCLCLGGGGHMTGYMEGVGSVICWGIGGNF